MLAEDSDRWWGVLYDAHNHLHDERLRLWRAGELERFPRMGLVEAVVNGTCEKDWPEVAALARAQSWVRPAFGLHPWRVKERTPDWQARLTGRLAEFPDAAVGEIGLDRWIADPDVEAQVSCFRWQLEVAAQEDRVAEIHCLRAWGLLAEVLRTSRLPTRGFLLHSYGGPAEMIPMFAKLGAYFSLSPYFGHERKAAQRAAFAKVPLDRLLVETDAPDMTPPDSLNPHPLGGLNHPANVTVSYALLAQVRDLPLSELTDIIGENYRRLFN